MPDRTHICITTACLLYSYMDHLRSMIRWGNSLMLSKQSAAQAEKGRQTVVGISRYASYAPRAV